MLTEQQLTDKILKHDHLYWVKNEPEISDAAYDELCQKLRDLNPNAPVLSMVHRAIIPKGKTIRHDNEMLSLDKVYTNEELFNWAKGVARTDSEQFRVAPKYDGVASEFVITDSGIVLATAGDDGWNGEDITDKTIITDFSRIPKKESKLCRGELVVMKSALPNLRRESNGEPYKTERAAAVGLLNADGTNRSIGRVIQFMPHSTSLGHCSLTELLTEIDWSALIKQEQAQDYPADGLVIALVDQEYAESLGATDHHPRHSIAFKFANPKGITKLLEVEWQVGKNRITPVAILKPVVISGCTHDRASLHNLDQIEKLGVTIGGKVEIERCGDVIPQITRVISKGSRLIEPPRQCPACGQSTEIVNQDVKCTNKLCGGMAARRLLDALTRIGVEDIGPGTASVLVRAGYQTLPQLFDMATQHWLELPGFAAKSAERMRRQFSNLKRTPIEDFKLIAAMNIPGVGLTLAAQICSKVLPGEILSIDLTTLDGIGETRQQEIRAGFDSALLAWAFMNLNLVVTKGLADRPLVCFTGADEMPRDQWIKRAEEAGYAYSKSVTKKLNILVASRTDSTKSKKAAQYGTNVVTYIEFAHMLEGMQNG